MNRPARRRIPMSQLYADAARAARLGGNPTETDVRCCINDLMDSYEKDGCIVHQGYSQPKALREVLKILRRNSHE